MSVYLDIIYMYTSVFKGVLKFHRNLSKEKNFDMIIYKYNVFRGNLFYL